MKYNFRVSFIRRQVNRVTHKLAKISRFYANHQTLYRDYHMNEMY